MPLPNQLIEERQRVLTNQRQNRADCDFTNFGKKNSQQGEKEEACCTLCVAAEAVHCKMPHTHPGAVTDPQS